MYSRAGWSRDVLDQPGRVVQGVPGQGSRVYTGRVYRAMYTTQGTPPYTTPLYRLPVLY